ncbi:unnamed protein product [Prunus armeniaca]|uniref:Uncharacterized protein n=1 Tax=Prunus armeniaca TaxID=36596 RepID=A0A6J5Y7S1_PRUAR|nr:hypothetical protein GBA52_026094 [Prunus armeniaca]KAH0976384.1 hypothetical protein GBA52_026103 [Prunus armeniaca]CAB4289666.1 unnamed protein product [Prunus armeniaca]CAB4320035.1 unnamed protein product [Prunus armeniaca]
MEKKNGRLWILLGECFGSMTKRFGRVAESLEDLALDVPDVQKQFTRYIERAKNPGWLDSSFSFSKSGHIAENGTD